MKCTACGEELAGGRCPFCGYRPTEADIAADAAWRRQKAAMDDGASGPDWRGDRPAAPRIRTKAGRKPAARPAAPKKALQKPVQKTAPARTKARARQRPAASGPAGSGKRRLGAGLLVKLLVAAWVLFCIWSFLQVLAGETGFDPFGLFGA